MNTATSVICQNSLSRDVKVFTFFFTLQNELKMFNFKIIGLWEWYRVISAEIRKQHGTTVNWADLDAFTHHCTLSPIRQSTSTFVRYFLRVIMGKWNYQLIDFVLHWSVYSYKSADTDYFRLYIGLGSILLHYFEEISFSRTNSNRTYRYEK